MPTQIELGVQKNPESKGQNEPKDDFNLMQFLSEVRSEFYKISWPSKDQVTKEFVAVLLLVAVLSGIVYVIDIILGAISNFFMGRI